MKIETNLSIKIDNVNVSYGEIPSAIFDNEYKDEELVYYIQTSNQEKHEELVDKIINLLKNQSYDHGSEWRKTRKDIIKSDKYSQLSLVAFRIKDSY